MLEAAEAIETVIGQQAALPEKNAALKSLAKRYSERLLVPSYLMVGL